MVRPLQMASPMIKKLLVVLSAFFALSIAGCGGSSDEGDQPTAESDSNLWNQCGSCDIWRENFQFFVNECWDNVDTPRSCNQYHVEADRFLTHDCYGSCGIGIWD